MADKMERFTQRARRVLSLAHEEAERLHHNYIGTEHLLLGLIREEGGIAGRVLRDLGVVAAVGRGLVDRLPGGGRRRWSGVSVTFDTALSIPYSNCYLLSGRVWN